MLCYERLLNMTYVANKNAFFRGMQFWSHCYTVVSYQALFRLTVYKIPTVYLSGAKNVCFCTIRDYGFPTMTPCQQLEHSKFKQSRETIGILLFFVNFYIEHFHGNFLVSMQIFVCLTLYLLVSSADNFCKQFGPRSGPTES